MKGTTTRSSVEDVPRLRSSHHLRNRANQDHATTKTGALSKLLIGAHVRTYARPTDTTRAVCRPSGYERLRMGYVRTYERNGAPSGGDTHIGHPTRNRPNTCATSRGRIIPVRIFTPKGGKKRGACEKGRRRGLAEATPILKNGPPVRRSSVAVAVVLTSRRSSTVPSVVACSCSVKLATLSACRSSGGRGCKSLRGKGTKTTPPSQNAHGQNWGVLRFRSRIMRGRTRAAPPQASTSEHVRTYRRTTATTPTGHPSPTSTANRSETWRCFYVNRASRTSLFPHGFTTSR